MTVGLPVIGVGARTSLGADLASSAAAARAGISNFADHPFMIDGTGRPMVVARDSGMAVETAGEDRLALLAAAAAVDSFDGLVPDGNGSRLALRLLLALPEPTRPSFPWNPSRLAEAVEDALADRVSLVGVHNTALGHAGGIAAVQRATALLGDGFEGACLVLGADSWIDALTLEWLDETQRLHSSARPFGFVPGEAAVGLLAGPPGIVARATAKAVLAGGNLSAEPNLLPEDPRLGLALTAAARNAFRPFEEHRVLAEAVFTDLNGMPERADEVGYTLVRVREQLATGCRMITPAEWFGDVGAATVPLMVALAIVAAEKGYGHEHTILLLLQSMGAERGALLVSLPAERAA